MRFYLPKIEGKHIELTDEAHTHAAYSLRIRVGDFVTVFDGSGVEYSCSVKSVKKDRTELDIISAAENVNEMQINLSLYLSVIKQDRFEFAVQKATELGVNNIIPVYSAFTQRGGSLNYDRLKRIAISACEQCGRCRLPNIESAIEFNDLLSRVHNTYMIFPWERELHDTLKSAIDTTKSDISVFIGPEGGIKESEKKLLVDAGARSVTLGKRILRAETAAIAALSVVCYEMGEWDL